MTRDPALFVQNGAVHMTQAKALEVAKRLHRTAHANNHTIGAASTWDAWVAALASCGLGVRIVRVEGEAE
jgi:hypothetical protein